MGPLSGQEKFPKSSAQLNGIPGVGQGGVGAPEVERLPQVALGGDWQGSPQATMGTLSTVGISGESSDLKGDCLSRAACPGEQGWGSQKVYTAPQAAWAPVLTPSIAAGGLGVATEEAGMVGWPQLEEGESQVFSPSGSLSLERKFSGLEEGRFPGKRRIKPS